MVRAPVASEGDRKSTRLNSSHGSISYAAFCLKKKNTTAVQRPERRNKSRRTPAAADLRCAPDLGGPATTPGDAAVHVFFFNDTATTEIYTLSLHDALPI